MIGPVREGPGRRKHRYKPKPDQARARGITRFASPRIIHHIHTDEKPPTISARGVWLGGSDGITVIGVRKYDFIRKSIFFFLPCCRLFRLCLHPERKVKNAGGGDNRALA